MSAALESWRRYPKATQRVVELSWAADPPPFSAGPGSVLPYGMGRIYRAIEKRKDVLYTPAIWFCIMSVIRLIPENIFKRLKL